MKKVFSLLFVSAFLASCSLPFFGQKNSATPQDGDTVAVHYVGTHDDGTEFESSRRPGRTEMRFVIGRRGMLKGFEDAVRTMKVGDVKKIRLEAKDAYGAEYVEETIPLSEYREFVTQTLPASALTGNPEQKMSLEQARQLLGSTEVGTKKNIGEATLTIISVSGTDAVVSINDPKAPFYGKTIAVGMKAIARDGSEIIVKKIMDKNVEIDIKQKQEIISKTDTEITVRVKNPHPLAGKALNFEIELLEIKSPVSPE